MSLTRSIFGLTASVLMLSACDEMSRFKQEKYECGLNPSGIFEIELRSMKVGDEASLVMAEGDATARIIFVDDTEFILEAPDLIMRINRETAKIKTTKGTHYQEMRCLKTEFKM